MRVCVCVTYRNTLQLIFSLFKRFKFTNLMYLYGFTLCSAQLLETLCFFLKF